jgi:hypothetical protein
MGAPKDVRDVKDRRDARDANAKRFSQDGFFGVGWGLLPPSTIRHDPARRAFGLNELR